MPSARTSSSGLAPRASRRWGPIGCARSFGADSGLDIDLFVGIQHADHGAQPIRLAAVAVLAPLELLPDLVCMIDADDHDVSLAGMVEGMAGGLELVEDGGDRADA